MATPITKAVKKSTSKKPTKKPVPAKKTISEPTIKKASFSGNIHRLKFGSKINAKVIKEYNTKVYGDAFKLTNIKFEKNHYWCADVTLVETKVKSVRRVRLDYFLSWMKIPDALKSDAIIKLVEAAKLEAAKAV